MQYFLIGLVVICLLPIIIPVGVVVFLGYLITKLGYVIVHGGDDNHLYYGRFPPPPPPPKKEM